MVIQREAYSQLREKITKGKVLILYGPRQVGKTFLLRKIEKDLSKKEKILFLNGESAIVQDKFSKRVPENFKRFIGNTSLLIIDEAHQVPEIGLALKMLIDSFSNLKIIVSGSASFTLAQKITEPLTGRKTIIYLYPVAAQELIKTEDSHFYYSI